MKKEFIRENFTVILAFALPVLLIIGVALSIYLPSLFVSTKYDFIYVSCSDGADYYYNCGSYLKSKYAVVNNKLVMNAVDPVQDLDGNKVPDINENHTVRIFFHDTKANESREITFEQAQAYSLSSLLTSPDGVTISNDYTYGGGCDFFIFGGCGGSSQGYYLTKGKGHKKLNLINSNERYYYADSFGFEGWVTP